MHGRLMHRGAAGHPAAVHLVVGSEALRAVAIGLPVHRAAELRLTVVFLHRAAAVDIGRQARPAAVTGLRAVLPAVGSNNLYPRS